MERPPTSLSPSSRRPLLLLLVSTACLLLSFTENADAQIPVNDRCSNASPLPPSMQSDMFFLEGSTVEATPEDVPTLCGGNWITTGNQGVWYLYLNRDLPQGETLVVTISTCNELTNFDTALTVFEGYCGEEGTGSSSLECVNGVDDDLECLTGRDIHSTISWHAQAGTRYYIYVHGSGRAEGGSFGQFGLQIMTDTPASSVTPTKSGASTTIWGSSWTSLSYVLGLWLWLFLSPRP